MCDYLSSLFHSFPTFVGFKWENSWHVAHMGEERGAYRVLVGKPQVKRPLGRPRRRWVDNIRMDLLEVGCGYGAGLGWPRIGTGGGRL